MLDVTLKERLPVKEADVFKPVQYDWRYENSINNGGEPLNLEGLLEHKYSQWRTNSIMSNHIDAIFYVNETNINYGISDRMHYDYMFYSIRKKKRFNKKKTEEEKRKEKLLLKENEVFEVIREYYKYNVQRTREVLKVLTQEQIELIIKKQEKGG